MSLKVFYIDAFNNNSFSGPFRLKGFEQAGFDTLSFDYRALNTVYGKQVLNRSLGNSLRVFRPDVIFVNKGHFDLDLKIIRMFLDQSPHTMMITWTGDQRGKVMDEVLPCAGLSHLLLHSNDDPNLAEEYGNNGIKNVAEHHCATDVDMYKPHNNWPKSMECDVTFFGGNNLRLRFPIGEFRRQLLIKISSNFNLKVYGCDWEGIFSDASTAFRERHAVAASAGKIQVCVNAYNTIYRYTSNRAWNALAMERLVLQHHFNGAETLLGEDKENLVYFREIEECLALIKYYLDNPIEAQDIAERGREFVKQNHTYYCRALELKDLFFKWMEDDKWSMESVP